MKIYKIAAIMLVLILIAGCKSKNEVILSPQERSSAKTIYDKGQKSIRKNPEKARLLFKEIMQLFPDSIYAQKAKIGIADSYFKSKDTASLILAANEYQEYVNLYPNSPDAIYAKFQIGMCYLKQMKKPGRDQTNTFKTIRHFENLISQRARYQHAQRSGNLCDPTAGREHPPLQIWRDFGLPDGLIRSVENSDDERRGEICDRPQQHSPRCPENSHRNLRPDVVSNTHQEMIKKTVECHPT